MGLKVCLDTNIFIAVKNREEGYEYCEKILDAVDEGLLRGIISTVVAAEVLVGFYRNNEVREAKKFVDHIVCTYEVQDVNIEIADIAARLRTKGLKLPDAIIAATAKVAGAVLVTKDENLRCNGVEVMSPEDFVNENNI